MMSYNDQPFDARTGFGSVCYSHPELALQIFYSLNLIMVGMGLPLYWRTDALDMQCLLSCDFPIRAVRCLCISFSNLNPCNIVAVLRI